MTTRRRSPVVFRRSRTSSSSRNLSGPATSTMPSAGGPTATRAISEATSSAEIGWNSTGANRTVSPRVASSVILRRNSKNWVAWTIVYGMPESRIRFSWVCLARKYPLSGSRSVPTTDRTTWWPTFARFSASRMLRVDLSKNSLTAESSNEGEFVTSTTASAPSRARSRPAPVMVSTPVPGEAATASCPWSANMATTLEPISPVPPKTTTFMMSPFSVGWRLSS